MNVVGQLMHVLKFATDCTTLYNSVVFDLLTGQNGKCIKQKRQNLYYIYTYVEKYIVNTKVILFIVVTH